jgi:lipopolysaccharide export system permease protein
LCYIQYIFRHLVGPTLLITLSLTGIVWLAQSLRFIDLIVNRGLSVSLFLYLTTLLMPSLLAVVLPVALFCATLYTYNKLQNDSELIVFGSAGLSRFQLAWPALLMALILTVISYSISLYLLPKSFREFKDLQYFIRNNYASVLLQEGVFNTPTAGMTVYVRKREPDGMLKGILVHDNSDTEHPTTMMAKQGYLVNSDAGPQFILKQGNRQEIDHDTGQLSLLHFEHYTLNISIYTETNQIRWREPNERYLDELFYPTDTDEALLPKLYAEGHQRLAWPLYNIVLCLVALSTLLSGQFNRRGQWRRMVIGTLAAIGVVAVALSMQNLTARIPHFAILMYSNIAMFASIGIWLLTRSRSLPWVKQNQLNASGSAA